jgi:aspartyl-tRNA(Asn)/glutamyl-tRNA(Gln) amidotransferase subunit C
MMAEPAPLTRTEAEYVARLARLALTEAELDLYAGQLAGVLEHAAAVSSLDTEGVPPTAHPLPLRNVLRDDVVVPCLDRDVVLEEAPAAEDGRFRVPRILGDSP